MPQYQKKKINKNQQTMGHTIHNLKLHKVIDIQKETHQYRRQSSL